MCVKGAEAKASYILVSDLYTAVAATRAGQYYIANSSIAM